MKLKYDITGILIEHQSKLLHKPLKLNRLFPIFDSYNIRMLHTIYNAHNLLMMQQIFSFLGHGPSSLSF